MSARSVAHALFRRRRLLATVWLASLAAGGGHVLLAAPVWRAEATLMVEAARPDAARALAALLESRDAHRRVVERHGDRLYPALSPADRLAAFAADLTVTPAPDAALVRLRLDSGDPVAAAAALAALIDALRDGNQAVFAPAADANGEAAGQAIAAREALAAFRRRHGVFDSASEREALLRRRSDLDGETAAVEAEAAVAADRLAALRARLAATPPTIALATENERPKAAEDARAKLFDLETREAELLSRYQESSVFVQNLQAEKRKVEGLLSELQAITPSRVTNGVNPVHQELEKEVFRTEAALSSAGAKAKAGQRRLAELDRRLEALDANARQLAELEGAVARAEARTGGGQGPAVDGIGIVQQASAESRPVGPGPRRVLAAAAAAGFALALLAVLLAQRFSTRLATPAEVERRLGLPVLTTIPRES